MLMDEVKIREAEIEARVRRALVVKGQGTIYRAIFK